jgi:hypothetical protein
MTKQKHTDVKVLSVYYHRMNNYQSEVLEFRIDVFLRDETYGAGGFNDSPDKTSLGSVSSMLRRKNSESI